MPVGGCDLAPGTAEVISTDVPVLVTCRSSAAISGQGRSQRSSVCWTNVPTSGFGAGDGVLSGPEAHRAN
jgi:hypothetical protein